LKVLNILTKIEYSWKGTWFWVRILWFFFDLLF